MAKVFFVFPCMWTGNECPVEYAPSKKELLQKLLDGGWVEKDGQWFAPKDYPQRQYSIDTEHGYIKEGFLEQGVIVEKKEDAAKIAELTRYTRELTAQEQLLDEERARAESLALQSQEI